MSQRDMFKKAIIEAMYEKYDSEQEKKRKNDKDNNRERARRS